MKRVATLTLAAQRCWRSKAGNSHKNRIARYPIMLLAITILTACIERGYLTESEIALGVHKTWYQSDKRIYHSALYTTRSEQLQHQGYLIGIENVVPPEGRKELNGFALPSKAGYAITHILRYGVGDHNVSPQNGDTCAVFTVIDRERKDVSREQQLFPLCPESLSASASGEPIIDVNILEADLEQTIRRIRPTHILVLVMGWNTQQSEAIKNQCPRWKYDRRCNKQKISAFGDRDHVAISLEAG
jgi:hypothetical protein